MSTDLKARIYYSMIISLPAASGKLQFSCLGLFGHFSYLAEEKFIHAFYFETVHMR